CDGRHGDREWAGHRWGGHGGGGWLGHHHGYERGEERYVHRYGDARARRLGLGDPAGGHHHRRQHPAALGRDEGRGRQHAHGARRHVVQQQHVGRHRDRERPRYRPAGWQRDHHGHQRGQERDLDDHGPSAAVGIARRLLRHAERVV